MEIFESAIERDMRAIASSDREREITHLINKHYKK
jgi:hypothetical protein